MQYELVPHATALLGVSHIVLRSNISCDGTEHIVSVGHIELALALLVTTPYGRMHR
ncbi:MAG: hypothetical protein IJZ04_00455 [Clostridia bacterium]|nr:hypothetical protein [Clostridia bacterium]